MGKGKRKRKGKKKKAAVLAGRWRRLGGVLIDGLIVSAIMYPLMSATGVLHANKGVQQMSIGERVAVFAAGWVVFLLLNGYLLWKRGQTIGKVAVGTRIVDPTDQVPGFGRLFVLRYLVLGVMTQIPIAGLFVALVDALFIFGKERRCLHDHMAGTRVVRV